MPEQETPQYEWEDGTHHDRIKCCTFERDGFTIIVEIIHDTDHDWGTGPDGFRGEFVTKWEPGAVENPRYMRERDVCQWFVPANSVKEITKDLLEEHSEEEAKEIAIKQIMEDLKIAADPDAAGLIAVGVQAKVSLKSVELASSSVWGVEIEYEEIEKNPHVLELIEEEMSKAISDAKKRLAALREQ